MDELHPANWRGASTSFVGRATELVELGRLLADPNIRLLTIVGPGGIGKTRLAVEAASAGAETFPDGVVFVSLRAARSVEDVTAAVADALAIPLTTAGDPFEQVLAVLREKRLLLVLDNTEQLGDAVAIFGRMLQAAPRIKLLATGRETLQLHEEWLFRLHGLCTPANAPASGQDAEALELFVQRARQTGYQVPDGDEREAASRICRLVEGMPLAIELAAAWTSTLSCAAIAAEVERGLDVLSTRMRNAPERHASLRAVCDQSWNMLKSAEQRAFTRLAAFHAGFSAEAASDVAGADLTMLEGLIAKSMLRRTPDGRFQIHELLRQYGLERLAAGSADAGSTNAALGRYYVRWLNRWYAECAEQGITVAALASIAPELDTIRAAWSDILARCDAEELRRAAYMLQQVYFVRGPFAEGCAITEQALAQLDARPETAVQRVAVAACLNALGWFRLREGRIGEARQAFIRSVDATGQLELPRPPGDATEPLAGLGICALVEGDYREAVRLGMAAHDRAVAEGHRGNQGLGLYVLVGVALAQGQNAVAQRCARRMLAVAEQLNNRWFLAYCRLELGKIAAALGAYGEAREQYRAAYELREEFGDPQGMTLALAGQAEASLHEQKLEEALRLYERGLEIYRYLGDQGGSAVALDGLGRAELAAGRYATARDNLAGALRIATDMAIVPLQLMVLTSVAELLIGLERLPAALALIQVLARHPAARHESNRRVQALIGRAAFGENEQLEAVQDGDLSDVVDAALDELAMLHLPAEPTVLPGRPDTASAADGQPLHLAEPLTAREREILGLIVAGAANAEIAAQLIISIGTVKWYTTQIYGKLGVRSRTQAVARAHGLGLLA